MTTSYFHHLMYGGWSRVITGTGLIVLGLSLLVASYGWRRAAASRPAVAPGELDCAQLARWQAEARARGLALFPAAGIATVALTGVLRPRLLVNPAYWASLDAGQRMLALAHEACHAQRCDNLRKLLLEGCALLYGLLPGVRRWADGYELHSELAVDQACRDSQDETAYRQLVAGAAAWVLAKIPAAASPGLTTAQLRLSGMAEQAGWPQPVRSELSHSDLRLRLRLLTTPAAPHRRGYSILAVTTCLLMAGLPVALLLSHPVPRCLLACYLGY